MNVSVLEQKRCIFAPANSLAAVLCCFKLGISSLHKCQIVPLKHIFDNEAFGILGARKKLIPTGASGAIAYLRAFSPALGNVQLFNNTDPENPTVPTGTHRSKFKRRNLHQLTDKRFLDCFHISYTPFGVLFAFVVSFSRQFAYIHILAQCRTNVNITFGEAKSMLTVRQQRRIISNRKE